MSLTRLRQDGIAARLRQKASASLCTWSLRLLEFVQVSGVRSVLVDTSILGWGQRFNMTSRDAYAYVNAAVAPVRLPRRR